MATNLAAYLLANFCEDAVVTSPPLGNIREVYCRRGSSASNISRVRHAEDASQDDAALACPVGKDSNVLIGNSPAKTKNLAVASVRESYVPDKRRELSLENCVRDSRRSDSTLETSIRDKRRSDLYLETSSTISCRRQNSGDSRGRANRGRANRTGGNKREETISILGSNLNITTVLNEGNVFLIGAENYVENYFSVSDDSEMKQITVSDRLTRGPETECQANEREPNKCSVDHRHSSNGDCCHSNTEARSGNNRNISAVCGSPQYVDVDNNAGSDPLLNRVGFMTSSADTERENCIKNQTEFTGIENEIKGDFGNIEHCEHPLPSGTVNPLNAEHLNQCPSTKMDRISECSDQSRDAGIAKDYASNSRNSVLGGQDIRVSEDYCGTIKSPDRSKAPTRNENAAGTLSTGRITKDSQALMNRKDSLFVHGRTNGDSFQEQELQFQDGSFNENSMFNAMVNDISESGASVHDEQQSTKLDSLISNSPENSPIQPSQPDTKCDSAKVNPPEDRSIHTVHQIDRCVSSSSNSSDDQGELGGRGVVQSQSTALLSEQRNGDVNVVNSTRSDKDIHDESRRSPAKESSSRDHLEDDESTFPSLVSSDSGVYTPICDSFREESAFPAPFRLTDTRVGNSDPEEYDSIQSELLFSLTESVDGSIASFNDFNNPMSGRIFRTGESGFRAGESGAISPGSDYWTRMYSGNVNLLSCGSDESIDSSVQDGDFACNRNHPSIEYSSIQSNALRHPSVDLRGNDASSDHEVVNTKTAIISGDKREKVHLDDAPGEVERLNVAECPPQLTEELKNAIRRALELEQRQLEKEERRKRKRYEIHGKRVDEDVYEAMEEDISSNDEEEDIGNERSLGSRNGGNLPGYRNSDSISKEQIGSVSEKHVSDDQKFRCVETTEVQQGSQNPSQMHSPPHNAFNSVRAKDKGGKMKVQETMTTSTPIRVSDPAQTVSSARHKQSAIPISGTMPTHQRSGINQTVPIPSIPIPSNPIPGNMASLIKTLKERGQKKRLAVSETEDKPSLLDDYLLISHKINSLLSGVKDMSRDAQENRTGFTALYHRTNNLSVEKDGLMRLRDAVLHGT